MPYFQYPSSIPKQLVKQVAEYLTPVTNLYLRLDLAAQGVQTPNAAKGTWAGTNAAEFTTNARSMSLTSGTLQTSTTPTGVSGNYAHAQYCSLPILIPVTISGAFNFGVAFLNTASGSGMVIKAALMVMDADGITVRGTLFNTSTIGPTLSTSTQEQSVIGSITPTPVAAQTGDYLLLELGYSTASGSNYGFATSGKTWINTSGTLGITDAQAYLQYAGSIQFNTGTPTLYLRLGETPSGTLPSGYAGAWTGSKNAAAGGANARKLDVTPGTSQQSVSFTPTPSSSNLAIAQYISDPLLAQIIPAQTWSAGWAYSSGLAAGQAHYIYIDVLESNGTTVRGTVCAIQQFASNANTAEQTVYGAAIGGSAVTVQVGDRLRIEAGLFIGASADTFGHYADGITPITATAVATSSAQSFISPAVPLFFPPAIQAVFAVMDILTIRDSTGAQGLPTPSEIITAITALATRGTPALANSLILGGSSVLSGSKAKADTLTLITSLSTRGTPSRTDPITLITTITQQSTRALSELLRLGGSAVPSGMLIGSTSLTVTDTVTESGKPVPTETVKIKEILAQQGIVTLTNPLTVQDSPVPVGTRSYSDGLTITTSPIFAGSGALITTLKIIDSAAQSGKPLSSDLTKIKETLVQQGILTVLNTAKVMDQAIILGTPRVANSLSISEALTFGLVFSFTVMDRLTIADTVRTQGTPNRTDQASITTMAGTTGTRALTAILVLKDSLIQAATPSITNTLPIATNLTSQGTIARSETPRLVDLAQPTGTHGLTDAMHVADSQTIKGSAAITNTLTITESKSTQATRALADAVHAQETIRTSGTPVIANPLHVADLISRLGSISVVDKMTETDATNLLEVIFFVVADRLNIKEGTTVLNTRVPMENLHAIDSPITQSAFTAQDRVALITTLGIIGSRTKTDTLTVVDRLAQTISFAVRDLLTIKDRPITRMQVAIHDRVSIRENLTFTLRLRSGRVLGVLTINAVTGTVTMGSVAGQVDSIGGLTGTITIG